MRNLCMIRPLMAVLFLSWGCSESDTSRPAVTIVEQTPVKRQSIGNCWLYAQASWLESLLKTSQGAEVNVSESYWTYWDFYHKLMNRDEMLEDGVLNTGGTWSLSRWIVSQYGWVEEGIFIAPESEAQISDAQLCAEKYILGAVREGGKLDPLLPRTSERVHAALREGFSCGGRWLIDMDGAYAQRHPSRETLVRNGAGEERTLEAWLRAWTEVRNPAHEYWAGFESKKLPSPAAMDRYAQLERQIKKALNDHHPVVLSLFVSFNAPDAWGLFNLTTLASRGYLGTTGGHMLVLHDYAVAEAPGRGVLGEGDLSEEEKQLALEGQLSYLVAKNSWGRDRPDRPWLGDGYSRFTWDYLTKTYYDEEAGRAYPFLQSVILPPGYDF